MAGRFIVVFEGYNLVSQAWPDLIYTHAAGPLSSLVSRLSCESSHFALTLGTKICQLARLLFTALH